MKDYQHYQLEDYLQDAHYRAWVRSGGPNQPSTEWYRRLANNEQQSSIASIAAEIIKASHIEEAEISSESKEKLISNTLEALRATREEQVSSRRNWLLPLSVAASIALLLVASWVYYFNRTATTELYSSISTPSTATTYTPIALADGSSVLLYPGSSLRFPKSFKGKKREVFLEGKAFFEIAKDAQKPFFVHSQEMVTKVLGTSFLVQAFEQDASFQVIVKTGKVSVSSNNKKATTVEPYDLEPNQALVLDREAGKMRKKVLPQPEVALSSPNNIQPLVFNDTGVATILETLSERYNVSIKLTGVSVLDCALTTTFTDEPLFEKLKIICQAIGPSTQYTVTESQIIVNTKGCNN